MKFNFSLITAVLFAALFSLCAVPDSTTSLSAQEKKASSLPGIETFRVMSFNILCTSSENEYWKERFPMIVEEIREVDPLIFGLQEPTPFQMTEFAKAFPDYAFVGVARDDGANQGEYSPVFYKKESFDLLDSNTFWLSETPEVAGSKSWESACRRIVTWAKLRCKKSNQTIIFANTHFDHISQQARQESARLLLARTQELTEDGKLPLFVTGDFNCNPTSLPYQTITYGYAGYSPLLDTARVARERVVEVGRTWNNRGKVPADDANHYIDYIFVNSRVYVQKFAVCPDTRNGIYPSDHNAIYSEVRFK